MITCCRSSVNPLMPYDNPDTVNYGMSDAGMLRSESSSRAILAEVIKHEILSCVIDLRSNHAPALIHADDPILGGVIEWYQETKVIENPGSMFFAGTINIYCQILSILQLIHSVFLSVEDDSGHWFHQESMGCGEHPFARGTHMLTYMEAYGFHHRLIIPSPEYMPQEDEILLAEEQPLPAAAASPTTDSPGYVPESDPDGGSRCLPLRKRVHFASPTPSHEVGESSAAGAARQDGPTIAREDPYSIARGDLYGFVDMVDVAHGHPMSRELDYGIRYMG
ncbi:hypothetical protein Tco_0450478 [Tanacetum coccineum]